MLTIDKQRALLATEVFCPAAYWRDALHRLTLPADEAQHLLPDFSE